MIHHFNRAGMNVVLDVPSGSVHLLDDAAYQVVQKVSKEELSSGALTTDLSAEEKEYGADTVAQIFKELANLVENGSLYSEDDYHQFESELGLSPIKAMCLHIAHDCNLRCSYCFASTGDFGGERQIMDFDTARHAIDYLIAHSGSRRNLEVDFFGGEPLLNLDVVKQTVDYTRNIEKEHGKNFRFTITTNGLALNEQTIDYINKTMDNVVLSLDGRKSVHDSMRPLPSGKGSYDAIVPKIKEMVKKRGDKEYYVRGTYTNQNLDFYEDVFSIAEMGIDQISVEPVVLEADNAHAITENDLATIDASYTILMNDMVDKIKQGGSCYNFFHFMLDLENGPCAIKRLKGCGSGNEYVAVTPDGEVYPCHQFVNDKELLMGHVKENTLNTAIKKTFAEANVLNKADCKDCWAKYFCSGGCNANNLNLNGDINKPHAISCEIEKNRLECALIIQIAKAQARANA